MPAAPCAFSTRAWVRADRSSRRGGGRLLDGWRSPSDESGPSTTGARSATARSSPRSSSCLKKSRRSVATRRTSRPPLASAERGLDEGRAAFGTRQGPGLLELIDDEEQPLRAGPLLDLRSPPRGRRPEMAEHHALRLAEEGPERLREVLPPAGRPGASSRRATLRPRAPPRAPTARRRRGPATTSRPRTAHDEDEGRGRELGQHGGRLGLAAEERRRCSAPNESNPR